jgi:hypothetical protein
MDGTGEHHSERGQPGSEDQKTYVLPHMWTLDLGKCSNVVDSLWVKFFEFPVDPGY